MIGRAGYKAFLLRGGGLAEAVAIALGTLALLVATLNDYGMAWDEGFTVEREERLKEWFGRVAGDDSPLSRAWSPSLSKLERRSTYLRRAGEDAGSPWSRESLRFYWQFAREEPNGHPPGYALLGLAGWAVSHRFVPMPGSYRFGPAVLFAATLGVVYRVMTRRYGRAAGLTAALSLLTMPRVFAHAHLACYDAPTLCFWFLAVAAFLKSVESRDGEGRDWSWAWAVAFGLAFGCAAATKLTGWFVPVPLAVWVAAYRDRKGMRNLIVGSLVAAVVVYAMTPTWWAEPVSGLRDFLRSNLSRQKLAPIPTQFFHKVYLFSLPWYNTIVWTAVVVPPVTLVLAVLGMGKVVAGGLRDGVGILLLGCWAFFMVLKGLPNAPGHDGERQFLAGFAFLACLAGVGVKQIGDCAARVVGPEWARGLMWAVVAGAVGAGAWETRRDHPLQLSYYNALIGGLGGATKAGLEPTYYWEAVTPDVRTWLNDHTEPGGSVGFVFPAVTFEYLHRWGLLKPSPLTPAGKGPRWFVVMNRPGHLKYPPGRIGPLLIEKARPVFVKSLAVAPDVPLITIYDGADAFAAELIVKRRRTP